LVQITHHSKKIVMEKKKKTFIPHGLLGATACPKSLAPKSGGKTPKNFVPAGLDIQPTTDPFANELLRIFENAKVPRLPKRKKN